MNYPNTKCKACAAEPGEPCVRRFNNRKPYRTYIHWWRR